MAVGRIANYGDQVPEIWAADLYSQAQNLTFWHNFEGPPGSAMPIIRRDELEKQAGDTIRVDIVLGLTGAGLTGDASDALVEGNEEALKFRQQTITVNSLQHGVRWTKLVQKMITHEMRGTAQNELAKWLAANVDNRIFNELTGQSSYTTMPTLNKWFAGTATSRNTIEDTDAAGRLTLADISRVKAYAQTELKIQPLRVENGLEYFGMVLHPYTALSMKINDTTWAQAQREAAAMGQDNPLFTGALGVWDGVILYESARVPRSLNDHATTDIQVADNVFFGAQALSRGYGSYPDWTEEMFSYGQEAGIATWMLLGQKLNVFDLTSAGGAAAADLTAIGSMVVHAAAVAPTA